VNGCNNEHTNMSLRAGEGNLSLIPVRRTRWIAAVAALWLLLLLSLAVWWTVHAYQQAQHIADLEALAGKSGSMVSAELEGTRSMLVGESTFFVALLLALTAALAWLYWRESQRARSMQAFFAAVTHELRTPLTSIRLQAEAIADGDQRVELARRLLEDSHRLESQIDKTLELARIEGGGPLAEQAVPLSGWLDRIVADMASTWGDRLDLQAHVADSLPAVLADASAVQMVLRNLIENSVRHSGQNPVHVRLTAREATGIVVLEYHDNGRGLSGDPKNYGRLFGRGGDSSGTGVGLYLVRALMKRMGGRVEFIAAPGEAFRAELFFRAANETST
jgi:signal transduction histidine kinase